MARPSPSSSSIPTGRWTSPPATCATPSSATSPRAKIAAAKATSARLWRPPSPDCWTPASPSSLTHGRYPLYRRFGFDVFTHHSGIFVTPEQIERTFGTEVPKDGEQWLVIGEGRYYIDDLLVITDVTATTLTECKTALLAAASIARARGKQRILIEHPAAPSYGSRYPLYPTLDTPLVELARACGAEIRVQGADPESGTIPDADWIKVLDVAGFLRAAIACRKPERPSLTGRIGIETDAGTVTLDVSHKGIHITEGIDSGVPVVKWPSAAVAQLVTGYRTASVLDLIHNTALPNDVIALLDALFPPGWRFSRNESWTYKA